METLKSIPGSLMGIPIKYLCVTTLPAGHRWSLQLICLVAVLLQDCAVQMFFCRKLQEQCKNCSFWLDGFFREVQEPFNDDGCVRGLSDRGVQSPVPVGIEPVLSLPDQPENTWLNYSFWPAVSLTLLDYFF